MTDVKGKKMPVKKRCGCCDQLVDERDWDGLYTCCDDCAFCTSLEHFPCCHGTCKDA